MPEIVVLDTHIWVWWLNDKFSYLSAQQIDCIEQTERVAVSVISCFEIAQLVKRERLILPLPANDWIQEALSPAGIELFPLSPDITCRAVIKTRLAQGAGHKAQGAKGIILPQRILSRKGRGEKSKGCKAEGQRGGWMGNTNGGKQNGNQMKGGAKCLKRSF